jgi:alpha-beta hydrolase superfamily lysophospholipase
LIVKVYAKPPARSYFVGCSNGGRQSMVATQRYPDMFDGVIAAAPAYRVPNDDIRCRGHKFGHDGAHLGRFWPSPKV